MSRLDFEIDHYAYNPSPKRLNRFRNPFKRPDVLSVSDAKEKFSFITSNEEMYSPFKVHGTPSWQKQEMKHKRLYPRPTSRRSSSLPPRNSASKASMTDDLPAFDNSIDSTAASLRSVRRSMKGSQTEMALSSLDSAKPPSLPNSYKKTTTNTNVNLMSDSAKSNQSMNSSTSPRDVALNGGPLFDAINSITSGSGRGRGLSGEGYTTTTINHNRSQESSEETRVKNKPPELSSATADRDIMVYNTKKSVFEEKSVVKKAPPKQNGRVPSLESPPSAISNAADSQPAAAIAESTTPRFWGRPTPRWTSHSTHFEKSPGVEYDRSEAKEKYEMVTKFSGYNIPENNRSPIKRNLKRATISSHKGIGEKQSEYGSHFTMVEQFAQKPTPDWYTWDNYTLKPY